MAEFAANNAASEMTKCTLFNAMQGKDSRMTYTSERAEGHDHWQFDADLVQSTMDQIYEHLHVNIWWTQAIEEENGNTAQLQAPNRQEGNAGSVDAGHVRTMRPPW